ncbi:MAG: hypothetical protein WCP21_16745 [Armatimonadota bacterium]
MKAISSFLLCLLLGTLACHAADGPAAQRSLLYIRGGNIWVCDAQGANLQQLTKSGLYATAQWTSGGQAIAGFVVDSELTVRRVNLISADGVFQGALIGNVVQLADTPGGQTVALVQRRGDKWEALEVPSGRCLTGVLTGVAPSLSPDGHTIAYHLQSHVQPISLASSVVYLTDLSAPAKPRRLSPPLGKQVYEGNASYASYFDGPTDFLCWSPDGSRMVVFRYIFENDDWGGSGHCVTPVTRWAPTPLTQLGVGSDDLQWRPKADSPQIAVTQTGRHGPCWAVLVEGEKATSLPGLDAEGWEKSPQNSHSLGWSPGGRYVLTAADDDGYVALTDVDARRELPRRLTGATEASVDATEQTVAYVRDGQVYVQSLASLASGSGAGKKIGPGKGVAWRQ